MPERRTVPRKKMAFYFQVLDARTEELFGHLTDVSVKGVMLDRPQPVQPGTVFHLRIDTPPGTASTKFIVFTAKSKWCKTDPIVPNVYNVGMEIVEMSPHDAEIYRRIVDLYAS